MVNKTAENMSTAQCTLNIMWETISHFKLSCCKNYSSYYFNYDVINTLFKDEVDKFKVVHTIYIAPTIGLCTILKFLGLVSVSFSSIL